MEISQNRFGQLQCCECLQSGCSEWDALTPHEQAILDDAKVRQRYAKKEIIFRQSDPCQGVYCVQSGLVGVRKTDADGESVLVRLAFPGDTLGYRPCLAEEPHRGTGEVLEETTVCFIDSSVVRHIISQNTALSLRFLKIMARSMGEAEEKYFENVTLDIRSRFCHLLVVLMDHYGKTNGSAEISFDMPLSRQDLAAVIGARPESMSRVVKDLNDDGIVLISGRNVRIPEKEKLVERLDH